MQNNVRAKTNKIIVFVIFISFALIMLVFVSHMRDKSNQSVYHSDNALIFPAPRDLTSFELSFTEDHAFTQQNLLGKWTLLFFGFTHCASICPTTLSMLGSIYPKLHEAQENLQVIFVSLDPDRDKKNVLENYVHSFHPDFLAASGTVQNLRKLQSQLGIYSAREEESNDAYQILHTSSIILINPKGQWAGVFKYGMNAHEFQQTFSESLNSLSKPLKA